jgi:hypothetical protein
MDSVVSTPRFKLLIKYKKLAQELKNTEKELESAALELAVTNDCINEAQD